MPFNYCRQSSKSKLQKNFQYLQCNKINMSNADYYESQEQQTQSLTKSNKGQLPRFVKNSMENISQEKIVINLSKTQYDIIQIAAEEVGWTVQYSKKSENWDVMWVDRYIGPQELFRLNDHQKISHFPGIDIFAKKNLLGKNLMKMAKYFPEQYNYFPWTWSLPSEYGDLKRHQQKLLTQNKKQIYIFKPSASCQGKGIKLCQQSEDLVGKAGIAQIYINNPLLIQNLKFDLRLYVLIYGSDPIRIYLYEQGLARFATQNYVKAQKTNMKDTYVHLTNYAINKNNKKFIFNKDQGNMDKGHKRSLGFVWRYLTKKGVNVQELKSKIQRIIVKTLLIGQPMLSHVYHLSQPDNVSNDLIFHILGFDVLIKDDYQPILIQINHTPSFTTDTPLDKKIKKNLIKDTLKILNVTLESKKQKISQKIDFFEKRAQRKATKLSSDQKYYLKQKIINQKDEYQQKNPSGYKRIYPLEDKMYQMIENQAIKIFQEETRMKSNSKSMSPSKNSSGDIQSPGKGRLNSGIASSTMGALKKNLSYQEANNILKKLPNSSTMPVRTKLKQKLPIIPLSFSKDYGGVSVSLSAHFSRNIVSKVEFKGEDIFKEIQKKRIQSTQRMQKKKKPYMVDLFEDSQKDNNNNALIPATKIDLMFSLGESLGQTQKKLILGQKQKKFFQFLNQSSIQLLKMKRQEKDKLRNILFKKKQINYGKHNQTKNDFRF